MASSRGDRTIHNVCHDVATRPTREIEAKRKHLQARNRAMRVGMGWRNAKMAAPNAHAWRDAHGPMGSSFFACKAGRFMG